MRGRLRVNLLSVSAVRVFSQSILVFFQMSYMATRALPRYRGV